MKMVNSPLYIGKEVMKSIEMSSHTKDDNGNGCRSPVGLLLEGFSI